MISSFSNEFARLHGSHGNLRFSQNNELIVSDDSAFVKVKPKSSCLEPMKKINENLESIKSASSHTEKCLFDFKGKDTRKLSDEDYDQLYKQLIDALNNEENPQILKKEHPHLPDISKLPGMIYFLNVDRRSRRPPHIGISFRSYSDRHYTTVDRENPIICKVKEFPQKDNQTHVYRLYHYYSGNKRRKEKKRRMENEEIFTAKKRKDV